MNALSTLNIKNLESEVLKTVKNLFLTKSFPSCASVHVPGTDLKVLYSVAECITDTGSEKLFSFSLGYYKFGIIVDRSEHFHLKDASDFLDLDLAKIIEDLISNAEKKVEKYAEYLK